MTADDFLRWTPPDDRRYELLAGEVVAMTEPTRAHGTLVVRLAGTNAEEGKRMLDESGLAVISATSLADAAEKVVAEVNKQKNA